jgi:hypothetical protein
LHDDRRASAHDDAADIDRYGGATRFRIIIDR